jgi:D-glycero-D-manno-heptose 1,7-bisphosphate phosphatase
LSLRPAVFLDRDGVLNRAFPDGRATRPPRDLLELELLSGVAEAVARLHAAGFALVGASNQPDVPRGLTTRAAVEALNAELRARLPPLLAILTCFHDDADGCACRKPRPGLLLDGAARFGLDLGRSFMVGDRWSDVAAGQAAGCTTLLVDGPFSQAERCRPDWRGDGLPAAADWILARAGPARP